ncbi:hypothetical protein A4G29_12275 [Mycobacterium kansasii]|nr:hypothetical protein A4G29_12275 [Mycobacterium kansasii]
MKAIVANPAALAASSLTEPYVNRRSRGVDFTVIQAEGPAQRFVRSRAKLSVRLVQHRQNCPR